MLHLFASGAAEALLSALYSYKLDSFFVEGSIFKPYGRGVVVIIEESIEIGVWLLKLIAFF